MKVFIVAFCICILFSYTNGFLFDLTASGNGSSLGQIHGKGNATIENDYKIKGLGNAGVANALGLPSDAKGSGEVSIKGKTHLEGEGTADLQLAGKGQGNVGV